MKRVAGICDLLKSFTQMSTRSGAAYVSCSPFTVLCPACCCVMRIHVLQAAGDAFQRVREAYEVRCCIIATLCAKFLSRKNYVLRRQFHIRWFCHCIKERLFGTLCKRFVLFGRFFQTMLVGASMIVNLNGEPRRFDFLISWVGD